MKGWKVPYVCGVGVSLVFAGMKTRTPNASVQVNLSRKVEFPAALLDFLRSLLSNHLSYMGVFILAGNLSKLSTTFM
jgi:hypothetical protein